MTTLESKRNRTRAGLYVIKGEGYAAPKDRQPEKTADRKSVIEQQARFFGELEAAGMDISFYEEHIAQRRQTLEDVVAILIEDDLALAQNQPGHSEILRAMIERTMPLIAVFNLRDRLPFAHKKAPQATLEKKRTQLAIADSEFLDNDTKKALLSVLETYSPQLDGLKLDDAAAVARFRETLDQAREAETLEGRGVVRSLEKARAQRAAKLNRGKAPASSIPPSVA